MGAKHKDQTCGTLLSKALNNSKKHGAETKIVHLTCYKNRMKELHPTIKKANGIIFATPVYWYTMSALMKELIDTFLGLDGPTSPDKQEYILENKVAGFIATCEQDGGMKTILDLAGTLNGMGMLIPPFATFYHNVHLVKLVTEYDKKLSRKLKEILWQKEDHLLLGENMVKYARLLVGQSPVEPRNSN